jgi:diguanylate cyclase (GGDEF)-like protein
MNGAVVLLIVNAVVAGLFALSYFLIARISRGQRPVIAFGVSYLLGMVTPISEIAIRLTDYPAPFMLASYMALLGGFLAMAAALSIFHRKRPPWTAIATLAVLGLITRIAIWGGTRDDLIYELAFQAPLALGILLCSHTAFRTGKGQLNHTLAGLFLLSGLNFFIKPFVAAALGSGQTARDYAGSAYALYSQASTAILLTAAGLTVLLIVIQTTIQEYVRTAETDHLSGLLNRRGFDRQGQALLASAPIGKRQLCAVMIDLDHFKRINDCFGHDMGDRVIRAFAEILRSTAPKSAHLARTGGEEFVILLNRVTAPAAGLIVEAIRAHTREHGHGDLPTFSFSAGIAQYQAGDSLADLMRRADQACYRAKTLGRDRIETDDGIAADSTASTVVPFKAVNA